MGVRNFCVKLGKVGILNRVPEGRNPCNRELQPTTRNIEPLYGSLRSGRPRTGLNHVQLQEIFACTRLFLKAPPVDEVQRLGIIQIFYKYRTNTNKHTIFNTPWKI